MYSLIIFSFFFRTKKDEGLQYQEELKTKDSKIERYEKKMVQSELDIQVCFLNILFNFNFNLAFNFQKLEN